MLFRSVALAYKHARVEEQNHQDMTSENDELTTKPRTKEVHEIGVVASSEESQRVEQRMCWEPEGSIRNDQSSRKPRKWKKRKYRHT